MEDKPFNTASLREITDQYDRGDISYGKMVDLINEKSERNKEKVSAIKVPSDEDIQRKIESLRGWILIEKDFFEKGAYWMREIILNLNK